MSDMTVEEFDRQTVERRVDGTDLRQDVDAIPLVLDHALATTDLPLDAVQALGQRTLVIAILHEADRMLWKSLRRKLLVARKSDAVPMAAAATIGLSRPATASGIAATL